jgi:hypothetical protein
MHIAIIVLAVIGLYSLIRYIAFHRKNAVAYYLRELVWNERDRLTGTNWKIPFLVIMEAWCKKEMSSLFEEGSQHALLSAQIYDGRYLTLHVYYGPGESDRPHRLDLIFHDASLSQTKHLVWVARPGQVLLGDMRPFFFSQECLALNTLDDFVREQGFPGLKPLKQST